MLQGTLNIGNLDVRITVQSQTELTNGIGEIYTSAWATHTTIWAKAIDPVSSNQQNEDEEAMRETATSRKTFMVRYITSIDEKMRIYDGTFYWYISRITLGTRKNNTLLHTERRD